MAGINDPSWRRLLRRTIMRLIDLLVATFGIVALSPVMALICVLEFIFHGWPPHFIQRRAGLHGRTFRLFKFRSMSNATDAHGNPLPDAERLTPFGQWLRSTSLDELPQLFNLLRGDVTLVGPRPLLPQYNEQYSERQRLRLQVVPGITGWAIVNGRSSTPWAQRFELDAWYVENETLPLNLKIIARTFGVVLGRSGVSADNHVTNPNPFEPA